MNTIHNNMKQKSPCTCEQRAKHGESEQKIFFACAVRRTPAPLL